MPRLERQFFNRNTVVVAKELIGKYLVRRIGNKLIVSKITETEAYCGQKDLACHASKGLTERTKVMFGPSGHAYIYLIYGMYHCFNIVTREEGCPEAVLIRGAELVRPKTQSPNIHKSQIKHKTQTDKNTNAYAFCALCFRMNGPGKLCRALKIDKSLNGVDLCKDNELWIECGREKLQRIKRGKRIGVDYAGKWKDKLWRFNLD